MPSTCRCALARGLRPPALDYDTTKIRQDSQARKPRRTRRKKPRRTIRVALWGGEEQGLHGSREYVLKHFGDPKKVVTPAHHNFSVYLNQDYGAGPYRGIYLQGNEHARTMLTAWMTPFEDFGMTVVSNQSVGSTDHVSFDDVGLPGFQFLQDRVPGTGGHTNLDFFDTMQADDLMKNAVVMAVLRVSRGDGRSARAAEDAAELT